MDIDGAVACPRRRLAAPTSAWNIVQCVWREADLRPHRLTRYMASNDPDFEAKAADIHRALPSRVSLE